MTKEEIEKIVTEEVNKAFKLVPTIDKKVNAIKLYTGAGGVRDFARTWYGGDYTWRQLRFLFKSGIVKGGSWWEPIKDKPGYARRYRGYQI